jgi:hypothetical protein
MGENKESFRDRLVKMAEAVEILEETFTESKKIEISIDLNERDFNIINENLSKNAEDKKCIVSIGNVDFIFLKK